MEHLYIKSEGKTLDSRGVFVIHAPNKVYVWIGNQLQGNNEKM
jgi:hypothetical protein